MNDWPKITLVTPSYNQGKYLEATILSVLNQNYPNLEYFIVDGGSTDNSLEIIKKYAKQITWWVSEPDNGQSHAINKGFRKATGEIINWLNSDDLLAEGALFAIADEFKKYPKIQFIYGQYRNLKNDILEPLRPNPTDQLPARYFYQFPFAQPACFFKRTLLEKYGFLDETFRFTMDYDLYVRFACNINFQQINETISYFRWHKESKTLNLSKVAEQEKHLVFSILINSLHYKEGISLLKDLELWENPYKKYNCTSTFLLNAKKYPILLYGFLKPYLIQYHVKGDFLKVRAILSYFKKNTKLIPFDKEIERLALIYRFSDGVIKLVRKIKN